MKSILNFFTISCFFLISIIYSSVSIAQSSEGIEEIVVTARKKEENIQETALSVSALSARDIENRVPTDIRDLAADSPNLIIDDLQQGPGSPTAIFIRGVGVSDVEKNFDPTTGVVLDGVFVGANSGAMLKTIDLESVEILRGPQGTLFGRNTVAGVINLTRTKPTGEVGGKLKVGYGDYDTSIIDGIFNFGTPNAAFKITGTHREQKEGYLTNLVDNKDLGREEYTQITIAGPNTLCAILQAYHLGFQTLKVQKHATQIYNDLKLISRRFDKHFDGIVDLRKKLEQAMTSTDSFGRDARSIMNTLNNIKDPGIVQETVEENSDKVKAFK